jgi:hypothetical protein
MSISTVFVAIKTGLQTVLEAAGEQLPVIHELGADHLSDAMDAPAIVWCPVGATGIEMISGPSAPVSRKLTLAEQKQRISDPKEVARREELIEIHVFGKTFEKCETLLNHLVAAMRYQLTAFSFKPISTDWKLGQADTSKPFHICIFNCKVAVPFTFEPLGVAKGPLSVEVTGDLVESLEETGG